MRLRTDNRASQHKQEIWFGRKNRISPRFRLGLADIYSVDVPLSYYLINIIIIDPDPEGWRPLEILTLSTLLL